MPAFWTFDKTMKRKKIVGGFVVLMTPRRGTVGWNLHIVRYLEGASQSIAAGRFDSCLRGTKCDGPVDTYEEALSLARLASYSVGSPLSGGSVSFWDDSVGVL